jgi:hypothetical protein
VTPSHVAASVRTPLILIQLNRVYLSKKALFLGERKMKVTKGKIRSDKFPSTLNPTGQYLEIVDIGSYEYIP